jgi:hypothetical protein
MIRAIKLLSIPLAIASLAFLASPVPIHAQSNGNASTEPSGGNSNNGSNPANTPSAPGTGNNAGPNGSNSGGGASNNGGSGNGH